MKHPPASQRVLLRGVGVIAVLFGAHMIRALASFADLAGVHIGSPVLALNLSAVSLTLAGLWLLTRARRSGTLRAAWCAAGFTVAGLGLTVHPGMAASTVATVLLTVAGAWLCSDIARDADARPWRRGLRGEIRRGWDRDAATCCALVIAAHVVASYFEGVLAWLPGPVETHGQAEALGLQSTALFDINALIAGLREEIPLLAFPAAVMAAARRPAWQILAVICLLRVIPHAYLGTPALATAVFAGASLWAYRATHRISPIIVAHTAFNGLTVVGGQMVLAFITAAAPFLLAVSPHQLRRAPAPTDRPARVRSTTR